MLAFNSGPLVLCGLPIRCPPAGSLQHTRRNGRFKLEIVCTQIRPSIRAVPAYTALGCRLWPCVRRDEPFCSTGRGVLHPSAGGISQAILDRLAPNSATSEACPKCPRHGLEVRRAIFIRLVDCG
jgi:hypothetical protein